MPRLTHASEALRRPIITNASFVHGYHIWMCKLGTAQIFPDRGIIKELKYRPCLLLSHEFNLLHVA